MSRDAKGPSPSEQSGGDDARDLYDELTDDLLYDPAIGRATMMGYPCVRLAGKFLASYDDKAGCLVVKLPRERVAELVEQRRRRPVRPGRQGLPRVGGDPHGRPGAVAARCSPRPSTSPGGSSRFTTVTTGMPKGTTTKAKARTSSCGILVVHAAVTSSGSAIPGPASKPATAALSCASAPCELPHAATCMPSGRTSAPPYAPMPRERATTGSSGTSEIGTLRPELLHGIRPGFVRHIL